MANSFPDKITSIPVFSLNPYNQTNVTRSIWFLGYIYNDYTTGADPKYIQYLDQRKVFQQGIVVISAQCSSNSYLTKTSVINCQEKDYSWTYTYDDTGSANKYPAHLFFSVIKNTDSYGRVTYGFKGDCYYLTEYYKEKNVFYMAIILSF